MTFEEAKRVLAALNDAGVDYVLIGSMAMAVHGVVRATRDIDFFIRPDPENIERMKRALKATFNNDPCIDEITATDLLGDYPAVQYGPPTSDVSLDILTRLGERYSYDNLDAELRDVDGVSVRVVTRAKLIQMKENTVRPQDKVDAMALRQVEEHSK